MRRAFPIVTFVLAFPSVLCSQRAAHSSILLATGVHTVGSPRDAASGLVMQAGYLRQYDRLALRLGPTYFQVNRYFGGESLRPRALGATLEFSYDLLTSRFRPYVIGGWGIYRLTDTRVKALGTYAAHHLSPAMVGGLGFQYRLGTAHVFTEARLHGFTNGGNWGSTFMPITAGIRF